MTCLDCGKEMANYEVHRMMHQVSYDVCESCGGLWLDKGELDKVALQVEGDIEFCLQEEAPGPASQKECPRCSGEHLHRVTFLGDDSIVLERCQNCGGFWLDGGQIGKIDSELARIMPVKGKGFSEFLTNTHLPHYRYTKRDSAETDFSVPVLPVQNATPEGTTKHKCPDCQVFFNSWRTSGVIIETCPKCGGLWLHEKELKVLKDHADDGDLRWTNDEIATIEKTSAVQSTRHCPECDGAFLLTTRFGNSGIMIDYCNNCHGVWLDRDEFEAMTRYLRDEPGAKGGIGALINAAIFQHPALANFLLRAGKVERLLGGG